MATVMADLDVADHDVVVGYLDRRLTRRCDTKVFDHLPIMA